MFELKIVTPKKTLVNGAEMTEVFVPAHRGELNIYPGHAPLVSTLSSGILRYKLKDSDANEEAVAISWGYVEVTPTGVNILAETAEAKSEIDLPRAKEAKKSAEENLEKDEITPEEIEKLHRKLKRADVRIQLAEDSKIH